MPWGKIALVVLLLLTVLMLVLVGVHKLGKKNSSTTPNPPGVQQAMQLLATANQKYLQGDNAQAREAYEQALPLFKAVDDRLGQANTLRGLGELERQLGRNAQAREYYRDAAIEYAMVGLRDEQAAMEVLSSTAT